MWDSIFQPHWRRGVISSANHHHAISQLCLEPMKCRSAYTKWQIESLSKMSWFTVSNAALLSRSHSSVKLPDSITFIRSDKTRIRAVWVEWKRLYADCMCDRRPFYYRCAISRLVTAFSSNLLMTDRFDTERKIHLLTGSRFGFFKIGETWDAFNKVGTVPSGTDLLKKILIIGERSVLQIFNSQFGIGPSSHCLDETSSMTFSTFCDSY